MDKIRKIRKLGKKVNKRVNKYFSEDRRLAKKLRPNLKEVRL